MGQLRGAGRRGGPRPRARAPPPRPHHGQWWKEERGPRVFVDYNQNAPHKTVFGAWCVRPRVGGQVSTPIGWDELADVVPDELTIATVPAGGRAAATRGRASRTARRTSRRCSSGLPATSPTASWTPPGRPSTRRCRTSRRGSRRAGKPQADLTHGSSSVGLCPARRRGRSQGDPMTDIASVPDDRPRRRDQRLARGELGPGPHGRRVVGAPGPRPAGPPPACRSTPTARA